MDPFVIIFAALLLIAWLMAYALDRREKRIVEKAMAAPSSRASRQEGIERAHRARQD